MNEFATVLCFCPISRLSLASLVLSTWSSVQHYVLTEDEARLSKLDGFSAVIVMDRFVTRPIVEALAAKLPVIVLAWNGRFEIQRYRELLRELAVIYMGTDESLEIDATYVPLINGSCPFARWRELYTRKSQFAVAGNATYHARWARTRASPNRIVNVLISAAGAIRRPRVLARTLQSGVVANKLIWAGNCYLDFAALGLTEIDQTTIQTRIDSIAANPDPDERLHAGLQLIRDWQVLSASTLAPERAHYAYYVTNTLLRWSVLGFLAATAKPATWFYGRDNLGLGLEFELYVHNFVRSDRVAFLEFGGKTSETGLYPRALHLLARGYYVIEIELSDDVITVVDRLRRELTARPHDFFVALELRREQLYTSLAADCDLREAQRRVWRDFAA